MCIRDRYLPGQGNSTINGGTSLDTLYLYNGKSTVAIGACSINSCFAKFQRNGVDSSVALTGIEVIVFTDGRYVVKN